MRFKFLPPFQTPFVPGAGWRRAAFVVGLILVAAVWYGTRTFAYYHIGPGWHPMARAYQDMAISLGEGKPLGQINLSRIERNQNVKADEAYKTEAMPGDEHCQYRALDPGYGLVFAVSRAIFPFAPESQVRPVLLQLFLDFCIPILLFVTFYRWGWFTAVAGAVLYCANSVFAASAITAWFYFWEAGVCLLSFLCLIWMYRLSKESVSSRWGLVALAVLLGLVLGAGVWIRNSWFVFGIILLASAACSKTLRRWVGIAAIVFAILAGLMVIRSTALNGYPSVSTRMVWHTAFQGIGKYANPYGIEDDDLYMFERTYARAGTHFNFCNYNEHDRAIRDDVMDLWRSDPGFIVRGYVQRLFTNVFLNFNGGNYELWNYGPLALAWLGLLAALCMGGELRMLSVLSFGLFLCMNAGYALVYYLFRQYSAPTQVALLLGTIAFLAAAGRGLQHVFRYGFRSPAIPAFGINGFTAANAVLIVTALLMTLIMLPPVQAYLTPHFPMSLRAESDDTVKQAIAELETELTHLPAARHAAFLAHMKQIAKTVDMEVFAKAKLKHLTFANGDGSFASAWFSSALGTESYEPLSRAARSIQGVGYRWVEGLNLSKPQTWNGEEFQFALLENQLLPANQVAVLLREKFKNWGWNLSENGGVWTAVHRGERCSVIRKEISKYYADQCEEP